MNCYKILKVTKLQCSSLVYNESRKLCCHARPKDTRVTFSAFSKTRLPPELWQALSCESPAVFLHTPVKEKGPWGPFYQLQLVLAKGRHLLQILLKALHIPLTIIYWRDSKMHSVCFNLGQFVLGFFTANKKYFWHLRSFFHPPSSLYLHSTYPHLLIHPFSPNIPAPILFISMLTL